ncbi:MAG: hypothetical protein LBR65_02100 [Culturomica sp.]|jgi:hypothetical protein|nr:hypothetical protein [Culturomica sp.]
MKFILTIVIVFQSFALFAQSKLSEEKRNEFEAQKIAFFTQLLELSPEEATVFWPLYNEMHKKIREQEEEKRKEIRRFRENKETTEKQSKELITKFLDYEQQVLNIKKEYYNKLTEKVPPYKVCKIEWVERRFHQQLLNKMRQQSPAAPKK